MRLLLFLLLTHEVWNAGAGNILFEGTDGQMLHKMSSNQIAGLFSVAPPEKEYRLDFNTDPLSKPIRPIKSQEKHKRDVVESQTNETLLDTTVSLPLADNSTSDLVATADANSPLFKPHFDRESYDFMVPEGINEKPYLIAVISYYVANGSESPVMSVTMDRLQWFEIGKIEQQQLSDSIEYRADIILRGGVDVQSNLTKASTYKFIVEASQPGLKSAATLRVEIVNFGSTTLRPATTTTVAPIEAANEETTTAKHPVNVTMDSSSQNLTSEPLEIELIHESVNSNAASDNVEAAMKVFEGMESSGFSEFETTPVEMTTPVDSVGSGFESSTLQTVTSSEKVAEESPSTAVSATSTTTTEQSPTVTTVPEEKSTEAGTTQTTTVQPAEGSGEGSGVVESIETIETTVSPSTGGESSTELDQLVLTTKKEEATPSSTSSTSGESSEEDNPLTDTVTIDANIVQADEEENKENGLELAISGAQDGLYSVESALRHGDMLRGLAIKITKADKQSRELVALYTDRPDLFSIRPSQVVSGDSAYLFLNNVHFRGEVKLKVSATYANITTRKFVSVRNTAVVAGQTDEERITSYSFSVGEDAPSGTTVGQIPGAAEMKIVGNGGKFALVGEDVVVACDNEAPCLDHEKQDTYYLMLLPNDGTSAPQEMVIRVVDKNDNPPSLATTGDVIRVSDNTLIMPFAVEVMDEDSEEAQSNDVSVGGPAASFLSLEKVDEKLYQVVVKSPAAAGKYQLTVSVSDGQTRQEKTIEVVVQNVHSRAHFRRSRYERSINADKVVKGNELVRVQLEGIPIDEARFVLLEGNPGWLTIDDYDGTIYFTKPHGIVYSGRYEVTAAAVNRTTGRLLAETRVAIHLKGGQDREEKVFQKELYETTLDRETSGEISVSVPVPSRTVVEVERDSLFALDHNGQLAQLDPESISLRGDSLVLSKEAVKDLRIVTFKVVADGKKATVLFHLSSSEEYVLNERKLAARPVFPRPWTRKDNIIKVSIPEELPIGHIAAVVPSWNPTDGKVVEARMEGDTDAFSYDRKTGIIRVARRLDSDVGGDRSKELRLISGSDGYESSATVEVAVEDIDDNPPVIDRQGLAGQIVVPENLSPLSTIARIGVRDADRVSRLQGLKVALSGDGSEHYAATVANGTIVVSVAEAALLDRESSPRHSVVVTVSDAANHSDAVVLTISLSDENDNVPRFVRDSYDVLAVEGWPAGLLIDRLVAEDKDQSERGRVTYSLGNHNAKYFSINATSGELSIARDLMGLAREQPYNLTAFATDGGVPPLNSSVTVRVKVSEPLERDRQGTLTFSAPPIDYSLVLKEDVPVNERVYQVKARPVSSDDGNRMNIKYSIEELGSNSSSFGIDESTGDIIVTHQLDYETQREHMVSRLKRKKIYIAKKNHEKEAIEEVTEGVDG